MSFTVNINLKCDVCKEVAPARAAAISTEERSDTGVLLSETMRLCPILPAGWAESQTHTEQHVCGACLFKQSEQHQKERKKP